MTTSEPRLFAVTGNPVLADKTPQMFNAALAASGIPGRCLRLAADSAKEAAELMTMLDIEGLRVAPPLDKEMLAQVAAADPAATAAGTANIVFFTANSGLRGCHLAATPAAHDENDPRDMADRAAATFARLAGPPGARRDIMAEALELDNKGFPGRIALIGFMGCGKSRNGRRLAHRMGWAFQDMDDAIEKTAGRSIPDIFARDGEDAFRAVETRVLEQFTRSVETVVSCGGGVITRPENRQMLKKHFLCVWLVASMDTIIARTAGSDRPLLAVENPRAKAEALFAQRRILYADCNDLVVSTETTCRREADAKIHEEIRAAFG